MEELTWCNFGAYYWESFILGTLLSEFNDIVYRPFWVLIGMKLLGHKVWL